MAKKSPTKKTSRTAEKPLKKTGSLAPAKVTKTLSPKAAPKHAAKPSTKSMAKKSTAKVSPAKKTVSKIVVKPKALKSVASTSLPAKKVVVAAPKASKSPKAKAGPTPQSSDRVLAQKFVRKPAARKNDLSPFLVRQRQRLLELKDTLLDSMRGVARDNLHSGTETSAFGMHQADAGSDAYDRDFALSMLSKEQGSLYEIDEALKRIEDGSYGVCDICEKPIRHDRLEALPFTRYTVECQAELEKRQHHHSVRPHINSLFGLTEEEAESEEEETLDNS
jgi:RNA polymerase-binding transcription factor DksA